MKIIDFDAKGNVVRFYLGDDDCNDYHGDDWDDIPYECNAGEVYDEYIKGHVDISFPWEYAILEPCHGEFGSSGFSKEDMRTRQVPCLIAVPKEVYGDSWVLDDFKRWVGADKTIKFYFGDKMEPREELVLFDRES